jgi:Xaa-Pro aminopeptidase
MRFSAAHFRAAPETGLPEYAIEAELLHEFRRHGAQAPAYPSIVAAGANACVLHHSAGRSELKAGELCLIDAGCELDGYASDVTRTFPATGTFSAPQRELYEIVHAAQDAAIAATRPGARKQDGHWAAVRVLAQGMLDVGLLDRNKVGDLDAVIESAAYRAFYMHGTGHWLGRDVHDVGEYLALDEAPVEQPDGMGGRVVRKPSRMLQPGMVLTIEPGIYVRPAEGVPERYWRADQPRRAGRGARDRGADARMSACAARAPWYIDSSKTEYPDRSACAKCTRDDAADGCASACSAALPRTPGRGIAIAWP